MSQYFFKIFIKFHLIDAINSIKMRPLVYQEMNNAGCFRTLLGLINPSEPCEEFFYCVQILVDAVSFQYILKRYIYLTM